jgi:hypothetical protein
MLACAISVSKAVARRNGRIWIIDEKTVADEARQLGVLDTAGMDTLGNPRTVEFLQTRLGLKQKPFPPDSRDPEVMARTVVQDIKNGNCAFVNSAAHWITIFGLDKQFDDQISWIGMDPLRTEIQRYTTDELANRLLGSSMSAPGVTGVMGEVWTFITLLPNARN